MHGSEWFVIGISGAPHSYKRQVSHFLFGILPQSTTRIVMQDNYFYSSNDFRGRLMPIYLPGSHDDQYNKETIDAVDHERMYQCIREILKIEYDLGSQRPILIVSGYRIYDDPRIRELVHLPLFIHTSGRFIRERYGRYLTHTVRHYIDFYIIPSYRQYRTRCIETLRNLIELSGMIEYDALCNKIKKLVVQHAQIKHRLADYRPMDVQNLKF